MTSREYEKQMALVQKYSIALNMKLAARIRQIYRDNMSGDGVLDKEKCAEQIVSAEMKVQALVKARLLKVYAAYIGVNEEAMAV
jgi:hypothetical protein